MHKDEGGTDGPFAVRRTIEWGECDAAGIVYYPNYHRWMDATFHALTAACGFDQRSLAAEHDLLGTPLREVSCEFLSPATYGETLDIGAFVERVGTSSLALRYEFERDGRSIATGRESRVFVRRAAGRIEAAPIPAAVRDALARHVASHEPGPGGRLS